MKKIIFFLLIAIMPMSLFSQRDNLELGIRYIKLGNSHRVVKNYNEANNFLNKGLKIASKENNKYWEAVAYEYIAYYHCDLGNQASALENLNKAKELYKSCIESPNAGSQNTINDVIAFIEQNNCPCEFSSIGNKGNISSQMSSKVYNFDNSRLSQLPTLPIDATNISLAFNRFAGIPAQLNQYKSLEHLNIPNNRIRDLTGIGSLTNLHYLNLSGNRIANIPDEIENLQNLFELDLSNNRIKKVNTGITKLKNLKILNLKGNKIPFVELKRIIQALPNTNIIHDLYIQK